MTHIIKSIKTYFDRNFRMSVFTNHKSDEPLLMWVKAELAGPIAEIRFPYIEFYEKFDIESKDLSSLIGASIQFETINSVNSLFPQISLYKNSFDYHKVLNITNINPSERNENSFSLIKNIYYEHWFYGKNGKNGKLKITLEDDTILFYDWQNRYLFPDFKWVQYFIEHCFISIEKVSSNEIVSINDFRHSKKFYQDTFKNWNSTTSKAYLDAVKDMYDAEKIGRGSSSNYYDMNNFVDDALSGFPDAYWNID